jgi:hypothetical protein
MHRHRLKPETAIRHIMQSHTLNKTLRGLADLLHHLDNGYCMTRDAHYALLQGVHDAWKCDREEGGGFLNMSDVVILARADKARVNFVTENPNITAEW